MATAAVVVTDVIVVIAVGEKRVLNFPDGRLGADGELEVFTLQQT